MVIGFDIYVLASEIHKKADLVLGVKSTFELEGIIRFLYR